MVRMILGLSLFAVIMVGGVWLLLAAFFPILALLLSVLASLFTV